MTWKNVTGADMSAWKGGGPERHKFGGRMLVLAGNAREARAWRYEVRQARGESSVRSVAEYVKSLSGYMMCGAQAFAAYISSSIGGEEGLGASRLVLEVWEGACAGT